MKVKELENGGACRWCGVPRGEHPVDVHDKDGEHMGYCLGDKHPVGKPAGVILENKK